MEELKITKEKVLAAAAKCSTAKEVLQSMFPEAFEGESKITFNHFPAIKSTKGDRLIEVRMGGDGSCVWLGNNFHWTIEEAYEGGGYLLTPIRKLP